jgi:hypothetical protein
MDKDQNEQLHHSTNLSGSNFGKGQLKNQSLLEKNVPGILGHTEARKNLNDKIMKKYKHGTALVKNPSDASYPSKDLPKTSLLYDKFMTSNKVRKNNLVTDGSANDRDMSPSGKEVSTHSQKKGYGERIISSSTGEQKGYASGAPTGPNTKEAPAPTDPKDMAHSSSFPVKSFLEPLSWSRTLKNNPFAPNPPNPNPSHPQKAQSSHKRTESLNLKYSNPPKPQPPNPQDSLNLAVRNSHPSTINPNPNPNQKAPTNPRPEGPPGKAKKIRSAKASSLGTANDFPQNNISGVSGGKNVTIGGDFGVEGKGGGKVGVSGGKKKVWKLLEEIKVRDRELPYFEKAKVIVKEFGAVKAFSVNTHQGTVRNYNEDRVSILLNAQQR